MRLDKLTTKFQEALGDAQTLALGNDHAYIEPAHLLVAMLRQDDGPRALLQRAGVNVPGLLAAAEAAMHRAAQGRRARSRCRSAATWSRCCRPPRRKRSSAATSSSPASCSCSPWPTPSRTSAASPAKTA